LFGPWSDAEGNRVEGHLVEAHLLGEMMTLLGSFPEDLLAAGKHSDAFFDETGKNALLIG
jgi:hypothetical protein